MLALCVESSHQRGMGHLFRALNFHACLLRHGISSMFITNRHGPATDILGQRGIPFEIASLDDLESDWEKGLIRKFGISLWLNDRLDTDRRHALCVKSAGVRLATFDDRGSGAELADLNIAALIFDDDPPLQGEKVLRGHEYLVLSPEIATHRHQRSDAARILVTMGGSDTHGVTATVAGILRKLGKAATLVLGPGFEHNAGLENVADGFVVKRGVPSLFAEFDRHDLAITAGGVTPFEANACGLPCISIATEPFEVAVCRHLEELGSSVYAGFRDDIDERVFSRNLDIAAMSRAGMQRISLDGAERILHELGLA